QAGAQAGAQAEAEAEEAEEKPAKKTVAQKILTCSICGKLCEDLSKFKRHLKRTHGPEDKFPCPSREQLGCLQMFKLKYSATVHNRIHTGEKYYKCNTCNARFCTANQLKQHKK
ncbi:MAG: MucR family transcriptional regulator, partial [Desulfobacterales bacterium]|nr:MucR family transcriptional regulator [Desulfobacterales bacterium]